MKDLVRLVVFRLEEQRYALRLDAVERSVRAAEITLLPKSPGIVLGVIDVAGRVLPVLDVRRRFGLPQRNIRPVDQFLIARTAQRTVVLAVDETLGVIEHTAKDIGRPDAIVPGLEQIHGIVQLDEGLVFIHDLEKFLSLDESRALDQALEVETVRGG